INVARAIKKLGGKATAIFPSGGYTGKFFNHLLLQEEVPSIIIDTASETRENFIVVDESTNHQYRFGMPGSVLLESEWMRCLERIEALTGIDYLVASGSLPPGVPPDIFAMLARISKKGNIKLIVDTSGDPLSHAANEGVYLLKPNIGELATLAGMKELKPEDVKAIASGIIAKGKVEVLAVSMGAAGCMLVTKSDCCLVTPPSVQRKSTVGAGDSMVGGIMYYLSLGKPLVDAVRYGVACGTAATMNSGTELCNKNDADRLYEATQVSDF
ncbi:MAG: 1-phosphofructokinase family hexose kinase, partial [Chitinophagaceae bacterium]